MLLERLIMGKEGVLLLREVRGRETRGRWWVSWEDGGLVRRKVG